MGSVALFGRRIAVGLLVASAGFCGCGGRPLRSTRGGAGAPAGEAGMTGEAGIGNQAVAKWGK
jgi:hypothetical protein